MACVRTHAYRTWRIGTKKRKFGELEIHWDKDHIYEINTIYVKICKPSLLVHNLISRGLTRICLLYANTLMVLIHVYTTCIIGISQNFVSVIFVINTLWILKDIWGLSSNWISSRSCQFHPMRSFCWNFHHWWFRFLLVIHTILWKPDLHNTVVEVVTVVLSLIRFECEVTPLDAANTLVPIKNSLMLIRQYSLCGMKNFSVVYLQWSFQSVSNQSFLPNSDRCHRNPRLSLPYISMVRTYLWHAQRS